MVLRVMIKLAENSLAEIFVACTIEGTHLNCSIRCSWTEIDKYLSTTPSYRK